MALQMSGNIRGMTISVMEASDKTRKVLVEIQLPKIGSLSLEYTKPEEYMELVNRLLDAAEAAWGTKKGIN